MRTILRVDIPGVFVGATDAERQAHKDDSKKENHQYTWQVKQGKVLQATIELTGQGGPRVAVQAERRKPTGTSATSGYGRTDHRSLDLVLDTRMITNPPEKWDRC